MEILLRVLLAISPVFIMVALAVAAYFAVRRRNRLKKLKWQIEDMFERDHNL